MGAVAGDSGSRFHINCLYLTNKRVESEAIMRRKLLFKSIVCGEWSGDLQYLPLEYITIFESEGAAGICQQCPTGYLLAFVDRAKPVDDQARFW
jgi:hypothetical protein